MKKSAKALLGAGAVFFGSGLAMNTFVLTRASKKISELKKEIEEKKKNAANGTHKKRKRRRK